jgi:hypothetical protein
MHTYTHTVSLRTYIHTHIHAYIHTYICTYIHTVNNMSMEDYHKLMSALRIGVHEDVQVTAKDRGETLLGENAHCVNQVCMYICMYV